MNSSTIKHRVRYSLYRPSVASIQPGVSLSDRPMPRGAETVLIVEDEHQLLDMFRLILRDRGYRVLEATCGREAVEICETHPGPIHILITDMVMPGMSGSELSNRLSSMRPGMEVLFLSGNNEATLDQKCQIAPEDDFLKKPFSVSNLLVTIQEILDRSSLQ